MSDTLFPVALLVGALAAVGLWLVRYALPNPEVLRGKIVERTHAAKGSVVPSLVPGTSIISGTGDTSWILVLEVQGQRRRFTASGEAWERVQVGDDVKAWVQAKTHITGVYVYQRSPAVAPDGER